MENNKNCKVNEDIFSNKEQYEKVLLEVVTEAIERDLRNKPNVDQILYDLFNSLTNTDIKKLSDQKKNWPGA